MLKNPRENSNKSVYHVSSDPFHLIEFAIFWWDEPASTSWHHSRLDYHSQHHWPSLGWNWTQQGESFHASGRCLETQASTGASKKLKCELNLYDEFRIMFRYVWGYVCLFRFFIFFGGEMSRMCQKQLHLENAQAPRWQKDRSWKAFVWWPFVQEKPWVVRSQARTAYQITTSLRKMGWRCSKRWLLRMLVLAMGNDEYIYIYMVYGAWGLLLSGCWGECIGQLPAHTRQVCLVILVEDKRYLREIRKVM